MAIDPRIAAALDAPLKGTASIDAQGLVLKKGKGFYAAAPGSGPAGETCRSCTHRYFHESGSGKRFHKCRLTNFSRGAGTDIRLSSSACSRWEKRA